MPSTFFLSQYKHLFGHFLIKEEYSGHISVFTVWQFFLPNLIAPHLIQCKHFCPIQFLGPCRHKDDNHHDIVMYVQSRVLKFWPFSFDVSVNSATDHTTMPTCTVCIHVPPAHVPVVQYNTIPYNIIQCHTIHGMSNC